MRPEESLSPCPFCGGAAEPPRLVGYEASVIACSNCECSMTMNTRSRAIATWNRRSPTPEHGGREGFVLVPREPTEAMVAAALVCDGIVLEDAEEDGEPDETTVYPARIYRAMLSANETTK